MAVLSLHSFAIFTLSTFVSLAQGRAENAICQITILLATKSRKQEEGNLALEYWLLRKNKSQGNFAHYYLVLNKTKIYYNLWRLQCYICLGMHEAEAYDFWHCMRLRLIKISAF